MAEVRIRLTIGTIRVEYRGSRALFERRIEPLLDAAHARAGLADAARPSPAAAGGPAPDAAEVTSSAAAAVAPPAGPVFQPSAPQRFVQYAAQVGDNAATVDQRIMAFSFYLWNYERREEFPADDIGAFFRTVHETPPQDLETRMEELAQSKRFLEPGPGTGVWRLTSKGVNYVKNRLLGSGA